MIPSAQALEDFASPFYILFIPHVEFSLDHSGLEIVLGFSQEVWCM